jgi:hypothetical protein
MKSNFYNQKNIYKKFYYTFYINATLNIKLFKVLNNNII